MARVNMTRAECEKQLAEHLEAMVEILHQYSPGSTYLYAAWSEDEGKQHFHINNEYFDHESLCRDTPVDCCKIGSKEWVSITV